MFSDKKIENSSPQKTRRQQPEKIKSNQTKNMK